MSQYDRSYAQININYYYLVSRFVLILDKTMGDEGGVGRPSCTHLFSRAADRLDCLVSSQKPNGMSTMSVVYNISKTPALL